MLSGLKQFKIRGLCSPWSPWHLLLMCSHKCAERIQSAAGSQSLGFFQLCSVAPAGAKVLALALCSEQQQSTETEISIYFSFFFLIKKMCFLWKVRQGINNVSEYRAEQGLCWNRIKIKFVSSSWVHALTEGWKEKVTAQQQISHFSEINARAAHQSKQSGTRKELALFLHISEHPHWTHQEFLSGALHPI